MERKTSGYGSHVPRFDRPRSPIAFAHRGGALAGPNIGIENTAAAFKHAYDLGYRHFETDVRASADGVAWLCHDEHLDRLAGLDIAIDQTVSVELDRVRVGGREPLMRLEEALERFDDVVFNLDIKSSDALRPTADVLARLGAHNRVTIASFNHRRVSLVRRLLPHVATTSSTFEAARHRIGWTTSRPVGLQVPTHWRGIRVITDSFVSRAHVRGQFVHAWTIDDEDAMHELLDMGVDGIMTDRIDVLKDVLMARGQWEDPA